MSSILAYNKHSHSIIWCRLMSNKCFTMFLINFRIITDSVSFTSPLLKIFCAEVVLKLENVPIKKLQKLTAAAHI